MKSSETRFVRHYEPSRQARVELVNGRIVDVVNGCYHDAGTSIILRGGVIESMPGPTSDPADATSDYSMDLQGKTVLPGLFNTHCHLAMTEPTIALGLSDLWRSRRFREQQLIKNLADCVAHGVTHVRDASQADLGENRALKERISKGEIPGPRILQAVVVGPTGSYLQEKAPLAMRAFGVRKVDPSEDYAGAVPFPIDATERQVRPAVDRAIDERGADVIKIGDQNPSLISGKPVPLMTTEQLSAVADQARRHGLQSTMHHSSVESFRRGVEAGVSSLAHVPMDAQLTPADVEALKASGCLSDPTAPPCFTQCGPGS